MKIFNNNKEELEKEIAGMRQRAERELEGARQEADRIIREAQEKGEKIKHEAKLQGLREIEEQREKLEIVSKNCENQIKTVQNLKRIVREKNLANLRNLASTVPMARVKKEIKRANKQLIYLEDVDENLQYAIELAKTKIQPPPEPAQPFDDDDLF